MQPELAPTSLRIHPLDPSRIGPEGLVARLMGTFEAAVNDAQLARLYAGVTDAMVSHAA